MSADNKWCQWNLDHVREDSTILFIGPTGCGKSAAMESVLRAKHLNRGIVMSPSPDAFCTYGRYIPSSFIHDEFSGELLQNIISFQHLQARKIEDMFRAESAIVKDRHFKTRADKWRGREEMLIERASRHQWSDRELQLAWKREIDEEKISNSVAEAAIIKFLSDRKHELRRPISMFMVLENLGKDIHNSVVKNLINDSRYSFMLLLIGVSYALDFPAKYRGAVDWLVIFPESLASHRQRIFQNFVGIFPNFAQFNDAMEVARANNGALVIHKRSASAVLEDAVFIFSPNLIGGSGFVGDERYLRVHEMFYREEEKKGTREKEGDWKETRGIKSGDVFGERK